MEKPFFFEHAQDSIFGVLHQPDDSVPQKGIVLCHPFGEEKLWSHRVYVNFAREAVKEGIAVFRFDFRGHGDSSGQSDENSIEGFMADIDAAVSRFRTECPSISSLGLLGLRFGGTLAALYAIRQPHVERVVLWEPILDGARYMQELLRINLSTQLAVYGKVQKNREAIVDEMKAGALANVDGYLLGSDFFDECDSINLAAIKPVSQSAETLVVQIAPNIRQKDREELQNLVQDASSAHFLKVEEPPFWREIKPYTSKTNELIAKTLEWWGR